MVKHKKGLLLIFIMSLSLFVISCFIYVTNISFSRSEESFILTDVEDRRISLFINDSFTTVIPSDNYYFLNINKSYCSNNETINWDGSSKTLSINPLTKKTECAIYLDSMYSDNTLKGNDPILGSGMIPIVYNDSGLAVYASLSDKWYDYSNKNWANAIILVDNPSKNYEVGDVIVDSDIKGYFVWIPRYDYQIFNLGLNDSTQNNSALNNINVRFSSSNTKDLETSCNYLSSECQEGKWVTHFAFASNNSTGFWVSKYQNRTYNDNIINNKSNEVYVSDFNDLFVKSYYYDRVNDSHMIKNGEWASILYLAYSDFGNITGGSTTGNITGVFDLTSNYYEYVSAYANNSDLEVFTDLSQFNNKYFDIYDSSELNNYESRILGDALGEMGPFDDNYLSSSINTYIQMPSNELPFIKRGGSNMFSSYASNGAKENTTSRVVLFTD